MFNFFKPIIKTYSDKVNYIEKQCKTRSLYDLIYLTDFGDTVLLLTNVPILKLTVDLHKIVNILHLNNPIPKIKLEHTTIKYFCSDNGYINENMNETIIKLMYVYISISNYYQDTRTTSVHSIFLKPYITLVTSLVDALYNELQKEEIENGKKKRNWYN